VEHRASFYRGFCSGTIFYESEIASLTSQPPTWRTRVFLLVCLLPLDQSGLGDPASSNATAGIDLGVKGVHKPSHHNKVGTPSRGMTCGATLKLKWNYIISLDVCGKLCSWKKLRQAENNKIYTHNTWPTDALFLYVFVFTIQSLWTSPTCFDPLLGQSSGTS
jgi:hypothetical protein